MRKTFPFAIVAGALAFSVVGLLPARAQQTCIVKQAADAAVQRQIALIDAAKVNPSAFFNGPNSCIAADLLKRFDLSNLIPDLSGFLTSGAQGLLNSVLDAAKRQVCRVLDEQLSDTIRSINRNMTGFQSQLSGDLFRQLNGSVTPITLPNITGLGGYTHVQSTAAGSAIDLAPTPQSPSPTTVPQSAPASPTPVTTPTAPGSTPPAGAFGGMFQ